MNRRIPRWRFELGRGEVAVGEECRKKGGTESAPSEDDIRGRFSAAIRLTVEARPGSATPIKAVRQVRLVAGPAFGFNRLGWERVWLCDPGSIREMYTVEIELKRAAKSVIDRIVNLRDSL